MISLISTAQAQLIISANVTLQGNRIGLSVVGLPTNAICDVLFSPDLAGIADWSLHFRGTPGQTIFSFPLPVSQSGFFQARSSLEAILSVNPLDLDGDGIANGSELPAGTNPLAADSDGDGVPDGIDAFPLDPSRWQILPVDPNDHAPPVITLIEPASAVLIP